MSARTRARATSAYIWVCAALPILTLVIALAVMGTGDYRDPFNP